MSTFTSFTDLPDDILFEIYSSIRNPMQLMEIATINKNHNELVHKGAWRKIKVSIRNDETLKKVLMEYSFTNIEIIGGYKRCKHFIQYKDYLRRCRKITLCSINLDNISDCLEECEDINYNGSYDASITEETAKYISKCKKIKFNGVDISGKLKYFRNCQYISLRSTKTSSSELIEFLKNTKNCSTFKSDHNNFTDEVLNDLKNIDRVGVKCFDFSQKGIKLLANCKKLNMANTGITLETLEYISNIKICKEIKLDAITCRKIKQKYVNCFDSFDKVSFDDGFTNDHIMFFPGLDKTAVANLRKIKSNKFVTKRFTKNGGLFIHFHTSGDSDFYVIGDDEISQLYNLRKISLSYAKLKMETFNKLILCEDLTLNSCELIGDYSSLTRLKKLKLEYKTNISRDGIINLQKLGLKVKLTGLSIFCI